MKTLGRILLAEDDENDIDLTLSALAENNLANEVDVVHDGDEALDYLFRRGPFTGRPAENPVVVLLDIKMPKVDGLEVLRQVRADPELCVLPVVILTSSHEEQDLVRSYRLGVNAYVVKPVEFQAFSEAVKLLGVFWALLNEPPPGASSRKKQDAGSPPGEKTT
ncbi:MAG: response regulator [Planctomycetaceae bacterium]|nr:MAG: response regulator [Planctomycetaceae bacterium]